MSFVHELNKALVDIGWKGKKLIFYTRLENGKRKKVRGRFAYIRHRPKPYDPWHILQAREIRPRWGFFITLTDVKWLGHFWGTMAFSFYTKNIEWTEAGLIDAFAEAMRMATKMLEAGENASSHTH